LCRLVNSYTSRAREGCTPLRYARACGARTGILFSRPTLFGFAFPPQHARNRACWGPRSLAFRVGSIMSRLRRWFIVDVIENVICIAELTVKTFLRELPDAAWWCDFILGVLPLPLAPLRQAQGRSWSVRMTGGKGMDDLYAVNSLRAGPRRKEGAFFLAYPPFSARVPTSTRKKRACWGTPFARLQGGLNNAAPAALVHRGCNRERYLYCRAHSKDVSKRTP